MVDWESEEQFRCYVYQMPDKLSDGYCFGGGRPIPFYNVDWFDAPASARQTLIGFIKVKSYYRPRQRFLVLSNHPNLTFTIEPETAHHPV